MAKKRALESPEEIICRQEQNRANMAKQRALKSPEEFNVNKQKQNRVNVDKKRCMLIP